MTGIDRKQHSIIFAAGAVILLMSVHILGIDILKESLEKCRNE